VWNKTIITNLTRLTFSIQHTHSWKYKTGHQVYKKPNQKAREIARRGRGMH